AGSDIAFLGGIIRYVIEHDKFFRDYLVAYTNAPTIINEQFRDTEDLDGLFSGLDPEGPSYDFHTWMYQGAEVQTASGERDQEYEDNVEGGGDPGAGEQPERGQDRSHTYQAGRGESHGSGGVAVEDSPERDDTLSHERCVFQIVKRHFSRYTP